MHSRLVIAFVCDVDDDLRVLLHLQRRARDRAVVREHAHGLLADPFRDGLDPKIELVPVLEVDDLGTGSFGKTSGLSGKSLVLHVSLLPARTKCLVFRRFALWRASFR